LVIGAVIFMRARRASECILGAMHSLACRARIKGHQSRPMYGNAFADASVGKKMIKKEKKAYPDGWDEHQIRQLAEYYDNQTEDEQVAEHEAAFLAEGQTVMVVPTELVPEIIQLIAKKQPA
jgi:hypothetical protein